MKIKDFIEVVRSYGSITLVIGGERIIVHNRKDENLLHYENREIEEIDITDIPGSCCYPELEIVIKEKKRILKDFSKIDFFR